MLEQCYTTLHFYHSNDFLLDKGSLLPCQIFIPANQRLDTIQMVITFCLTMSTLPVFLRQQKVCLIQYSEPEGSISCNALQG